MNDLEIKKEIVAAVEELGAKGVRLSRCASTLEISKRTLQRWMKETTRDRRKGSQRSIPHKLTIEENKKIIEVSCSPRFKDNYPSEIVAILASEGKYIASEASFYRVLKANRLLSHRRKSKAPIKRRKPRLKATGPDQVYSWDITWLRSDVNGIYYYLYLVVDIFSRRIVQWEIHNSESSEKAAKMLQKLAGKKLIRGATLHSDNGSPMKGYNMLAMMHSLGVVASYSRPNVSTDNPYSESLFRTLKYRPLYPGRFTSIEHSQEWVEKFVHWYNHDHLHSGISFVTPHERHYGKDLEILKVRRATYQAAYEENPQRWSRRPKLWERKEVVYINPVEEDLNSKIAS